MKLQVGFDKDGVIYDYTKAFHNYLRSSGIRPHLPEDYVPTCWNWFKEDPINITMEEYLQIHNQGIQDMQIFWIGELLDSEIPFQMQRIIDAGHQLNIVTYRMGVSAEVATYKFLFDNKLPFSKVIFSKDKTVVDNDYFIEDNLANYDALEAAGVKVYLLNQPYNQEDDNRRRVDSVKEYVDIILGETKWTQ